MVIRLVGPETYVYTSVCLASFGICQPCLYAAKGWTKQSALLHSTELEQSPWYRMTWRTRVLIALHGLDLTLYAPRRLQSLQDLPIKGTNFVALLTFAITHRTCTCVQPSFEIRAKLSQQSNSLTMKSRQIVLFLLMAALGRSESATLDLGDLDQYRVKDVGYVSMPWL